MSPQRLAEASAAPAGGVTPSSRGRDSVDGASVDSATANAAEPAELAEAVAVVVVSAVSAVGHAMYATPSA